MPATVCRAVALKTRFSREHLRKTANALDIRIWIFRIDYLAVAHYVVGNDERAGARELQGPLQILGVRRFVGVDEDEVEGGGGFADEGRKGLRGWANAQFYTVSEPGNFQILLRDFGVAWFEFEGDDEAIIRNCAGKPKRTVSAECADFKNALGAGGADQDFEEFALEGSDVDRGEIGCAIGVECVVESIAGSDQGIGEVAVDLLPDFVCFFGQGSPLGNQAIV